MCPEKTVYRALLILELVFEIRIQHQQTETDGEEEQTDRIPRMSKGKEGEDRRDKRLKPGMI